MLQIVGGLAKDMIYTGLPHSQQGGFCVNGAEVLASSTMCDGHNCEEFGNYSFYFCDILLVSARGIIKMYRLLGEFDCRVPPWN